MEQEFECLSTSPQNVRRQLLFMTPFKKRSAYPTKPSEIENSPNGKVSKSKLPLGAPNKKIVIDFGVENNYFNNQSNAFNMFNVEEENCGTDDFHTEYFGSAHTPGDFFFNSPFQTAKKSCKFNSGNINDYVSVSKESKHSNSFGESPFCKLLNESDKLSVKSYQTLSGINELDEEQEILREKHGEQLKVLERFLDLFRDRSVAIMSLFDRDAMFEIIGEENYPLDTTLNALANTFQSFEYEMNQLEYDFRFGFSGDNNEIIVTTSGRLAAIHQTSSFVISAKVLVQENLINHIKLQIT